MRTSIGIIMSLILLMGCDDSRVFEENVDFEQRIWIVNQKPSFEFTVEDTTRSYNVLFNVRHAVSYPFSRLFFKYALKDSSTVIKNEMTSAFLFDKNNGAPQGNSGLGDIYDLRVPLLTDFKFPKKGKYSVTLEQFMRTDSLPGVLAVGVRVERGR